MIGPGKKARALRCAAAAVTAFLLLFSAAYSETAGSVCDSCGREKPTQLYRITNAAGNTMYTNLCGDCRGSTEVIVFLQGGSMKPAESEEQGGTADAGKPVSSGEDLFRYEGPGFDTPEEAALYYLAGLKNQDFEQMLDAFAWETQADHFDYGSMVARAKGTDPAYTPGMPFTNELLRSANVEELRYTQTNAISRSLECFVNDEIYSSPTGSLRMTEEADIEAYFQRCDNGRIQQFSAMENIRIYTPDALTEGRFSMGKNPEYYIKLNAQYGADETRDIVIAADIADGTVLISPTAARYGDRWYLVNVSSMTNNILNIESNRKGFAVIPKEDAVQLKSIAPVSRISALPESVGAKIRYEGGGFSAPQKAVASYLEGLRDGNVQQMLRAFSWETQNERYSLKDYIRRMQVIFRDSPVRIPALNELAAASNLCSLRKQEGRKIYTAVRYYMLKDTDGDAGKMLLDGYRVDLKTDEEIDAFIRLYDSGRDRKLAQMSEITFYDPAALFPDFYGREQTVRIFEMNRRIYGADEICEVLAAADLGGETLICSPLLARYGDRWYLVSSSGLAFFYLNIESSRQAFFTVDGSPDEVLKQYLQGR